MAAASAVPLALTRRAIPPLAFFFIVFLPVAWLTGAPALYVLFAVLLMLVVAGAHWATSRTPSPSERGLG